MKPTCSNCKRPHGLGKRECQPFGPGGALLCAGCVFGEDAKPGRSLTPKPEFRATVEAQYSAQLAAAEARAGADECVAITDGAAAGPMVIPRPGKPGRQ